MTFFYVLTGLAVTGLSVILMVSNFRLHQILQPNVIIVMFVCHILQQMGASTVLLFDDGKELAALYFAICAVTALLIPFGGIIGGAILPVTKGQRERFRTLPLASEHDTREASLSFFLILFGLCSVLLVLYIWEAGSAPLRQLLLGLNSPEELKLARREASHGRIGFIFGMALRFIVPLLFVISLIGLTYFKGFTAKILCLGAVGVSLCYNAWAADKTSVAMLFVVAFLVMLLRKDESSWSGYGARTIRSAGRWLKKRRRRIYTIAIGLVILSIGYPFFIFLFKPASVQGLDYILQHVFLRIVFKPAMNSYHAIEAFTSSFDYTWFADIQKLALLLGWDYIDLSERIALYKGRAAFTNAPPTAIGNFYAQGGWLILVMGVFFAALLFKLLENLLYRARHKTVIHVSLYALLLYGAFRFSWANFHTILLTETMFPMIITLLVWKIFSSSRSSLTKWYPSAVRLKSY